MQELVTQLVQKAGLDEAQAKKAIQVIADFGKEKFPFAASYIDQFMGGDSAGDSTATGGFNIPGFKF